MSAGWETIYPEPPGNGWEPTVRLAARLLSGYGATDDEDRQNAELAIKTAENCDETGDDILTDASNYRVFVEKTGVDDRYSREFLTRFCFVVSLLRRTPKPTKH